MSHWLDEPDIPAEQPHAFIQWKGTDVCMDFFCPCGVGGHFDGSFAYVVKCTGCGRYWEMPAHVYAREATRPETDFWKEDQHVKVLEP